MAPTFEREFRLRRRIEAESGMPVSDEDWTAMKLEPWAEEDLKVDRTDHFISILNLRRTLEMAKLNQRRDSGRPSDQHLGRDEKEARLSGKNQSLGKLGPDEVRARFLSRHVARTAARCEEVRQFRSMFLGSPEAVLTEAQAEALITSPAAWLLRTDEMKRLDLPLSDHQGAVKLEASGVDASGYWEEISISLRWSGGEFTSPRRVYPSRESFLMEIDTSSSHPRKVRIWRGSLLYEVGRLADSMASWFSWTESSMAWFVLTGKYTAHQALKVTTSLNLSRADEYELATVNMTVLPFVSPVSVAARYARAQKDLLGRKTGPPIKLSKLAVLDFVLQRRSGAAGDMEWANLRREWNEFARREWKRKDWHYESYRHFRRDFLDTERRVLLPGHVPTFSGFKRVKFKPARVPPLFTYKLDESFPEERVGCVKCEKTAICRAYKRMGGSYDLPMEGIYLCRECHQFREEFSIKPADLHIRQSSVGYSFIPEKLKTARSRSRGAVTARQGKGSTRS